ncbi:MAG: anthranilate synthase component II [Fusicatenibacter sp.]
MILLVDNYDSFSYNLYQLVGAICPEIRVIRNDELTTDEIRRLSPEAIILSPGPGRPENAGRCVEIVQELGRNIPILGVCLGHQAICYAYGAKITYAKELMHGKQSMTEVDVSSPLFAGLPEEIQVARYHSLAADETSVPEEMRVTARTLDGEIMAVEHRKYPVYGVQFHPESIMTPEGKEILKNFVSIGKTMEIRKAGKVR